MRNNDMPLSLTPSLQGGDASGLVDAHVSNFGS